MKSKPIAIVVAWVLGICLLLLILVQTQSYAGIINNAGVVRGGTQRVVKLELAHIPSDETAERVDNLLGKLHSDEEDRPFKTSATIELTKDIEAVQIQWDLIKDEMAAIDRGQGSSSRLLLLSEEHFQLADEMVLSAQRRAENDFTWTIGISFVLAAIASTFVSLSERHHRIKMDASLRTDPLTKGRNLFAFEDEGGKLAGGAPDGSYAVVYSNISGFRVINDLYGRDAGDRVIHAFQGAFDAACEKGELSAHANADHFVALLRVGPSPAQRVYRFREEVAAWMSKCSDLVLPDAIECTYGAFVLPDRKFDMATAASNAAAVLKKGLSINGVAWYDDAFRMQLAHENNVARNCEQGIRNHEFEAYLQSQVSLSDGRLTGAELLCRWDSPELGFLSPDRFIPLFERNGFIAKLDFYMIEQACRCYPVAKAGGACDIRISVNLSRVTILQAGFEERIVELIAGFGVPASFLEIEVTEGLFAVDENIVIEAIERLRDRGFRFAMDDFGTGYSSLSLLRKLPIDVLKIDRGFLSQSTQTDRSLRVLKGAIELAKDLGIETVCEGIETEEQAALLADLGCDIGQGFLYSRPVPLQEFANLYDVKLGSAAHPDK